VNLLQFHSNFLTSCGLLCHLRDISRNILLFNKPFAKKNSQTIFPSLVFSTIVLKFEESAKRKKNKEGKMCQQVINLSVAYCQQTGGVIIFSNLVTSTFTESRTGKENPLNLVNLLGLLQALGGGSERLRCTAAKLSKYKGCSTLPWDSSASIMYTEEAEESFSFRQAEGGLRKRNVKKRKSLRSSSEMGAPVQRQPDS